jgi:hypothetical protein
MTNTASVNSQMQQLAESAVVAARDKFGVILDFTENSLQQLDILLQQAYEGYIKVSSGGNPASVSIENTVRIWGSYFGEVIRRSLGGDWIVDQKNVYLQIGSRRLDPLGQVRSRIVKGALYNVQNLFQGLLSGKPNNFEVASIEPGHEKNNSQTTIIEKKANNHLALYVVGLFGTLVLVGLCIFVVWIIQRQGVLSNPAIGGSLIPTFTQTFTSSPTSPPISTFTSTIEPTITITPTPRDTLTPFPTNTPRPTSTPVYGSFQDPAPIGMTIIRWSDEGLPVTLSDRFKMSATVLEVKRGNDAYHQAQLADKYNGLFYNPLLDGQEFLAIMIKADILEADPTTVFITYEYWHFTLRYSQDGNDIWSEDVLEKIAEGYPPLSGTFWRIFRIKQDTQPYLYFQPNLLINEDYGYRTSGAYFSLK